MPTFTQGNIFFAFFLQFALAFASAMTPLTHSVLFAEDTNAHVLTHTHTCMHTHATHMQHSGK